MNDLEEIDEQNSEDDSSSGLFEHFRFVADPGQTLLRVDKFLMHRIMHTSRTKIQYAAEAGNILVNEMPVKSNYRIKPNDVISVLLSYPPRDNHIDPEDIPLDIVYEDDALLVVNKAAGMVVHPGFGNYTGTLVNALAWRFKDQEWFDLNDPRPGLVHRIDKDTSGLLVIAKDEVSKMNLARQFFEKTTNRKYLALVWGDFVTDSGTIEGHIGRSLKNRIQMEVFPDGDYGKSAITHYQVVERFGYTTLIQCQLETGRTHQIRAHLKYIGHPLFNDELYGGDKILKGTTFTKYKQFVENCFQAMPRQALHAKTLGFIHPISKKEMYFDSELPTDFKTVIEKWQRYVVNREE